MQAKGEADLANTAPRYHQLAKALTEYVKKTGHFPRGTAPRKDAIDGGADYRRPDVRVSWMASLLPFLPESSFGNLNVDPNKEWYRDENLAAALYWWCRNTSSAAKTPPSRPPIRPCAASTASPIS